MDKDKKWGEFFLPAGERDPHFGRAGGFTYRIQCPPGSDVIHTLMTLRPEGIEEVMTDSLAPYIPLGVSYGHISFVTWPGGGEALPGVNEQMAGGLAPGLFELGERRYQLAALDDSRRREMAQARRLMDAIGEMEGHIAHLASTCADTSRLEGRAAGIAGRELPRGGPGGAIEIRYIDALTPTGHRRLYSTVDALAKRVYCLEDSFGLGRAMTDLLARMGAERGWQVWLCPGPFDGERGLHLIFPQLSLAFVTSDSWSRYQGPCRRVRLDSLLAGPERRPLRHEIKGLRGAIRAAADAAAASLERCASLEARMGEIYRSAGACEDEQGLAVRLAGLL